jgi:aarF domain-containing kinase
MTMSRWLCALTIACLSGLGAPGSWVTASQPLPRIGTHGERHPSPEQRAALRSLERRLERDLSNIKMDSHVPTRVELALRALVLAWIFAPVLLLAPLALYSSWFCTVFWYGLLARSLGRGGVAFIKWAQWASTRTDLLPDALCHALGTLRYSAPRHSARHSRHLVERAVGAPLRRYFDEFDLRPIASASIAQVHKARLHGLTVAVKVRHPRVVQQIATDFVLMTQFAALVSALGLLRWFDLEETVRQFSSVIAGQTQLQTEARHLQLCIRNFQAWPDCVFPRPLLASADVLVETFERGRHVSDWTDSPPRAEPANDARAALPAPTIAADASTGGALSPAVSHFVVCRGEDVYLKMLLQDNLMHADLHPGNLLLRLPDGSDRGRAASHPTLILVDLGMVAVLSRDEQRNFLGLLQAMGNGDGRAAARHVLRFADDQPSVDAAGFEAEMAELFTRDCRGYGTAPDFGLIVRGVLCAVRNHRVRVGSNYMTLIINALCLDGMARALQPSYNTLDASRPLLQLHEKLPRPLFRVMLPLARFMKARIDARHLKRAIQLSRRR